MSEAIQLISGILLLIVFVLLHIPMLRKAYRTIKEDYEQDKRIMIKEDYEEDKRIMLKEGYEQDKRVMYKKD